MTSLTHLSKHEAFVLELTQRTWPTLLMVPSGTAWHLFGTVGLQNIETTHRQLAFQAGVVWLCVQLFFITKYQ